MWFTLLLTLVLGMSLGVMLDELVLGGVEDKGSRNGDREDRTARFKAMLERELDLSPEQTAQLEGVLSTNNERARAFWSHTREEYRELRNDFRQEIRALLTPEQQKRFDDRMAEHDEKRHRRDSKKN
jgi:Spy/CpxP family protein refolding chaperone